MKYKVDFVMSKHVTREELLESKVKYLEAEVDNALLRLHQCKRRNREDKVRLRKVIGSYRSNLRVSAKIFNAINGKHKHGVCPRCLLNGDVTPMVHKEIYAGSFEFPIYTQRCCPKGH